MNGRPVIHHRLDARAMIALAHPLRIRIRDRLRREGPATATQLAKLFGESSGATSYHLRMLARHGLVEPDPDRGKGRERWWRATPGLFQIDVSELLEDDLARDALRLAAGELHRLAEQRLQTWLSERQNWSDAWRDATENTAYALRLTADETRALRDELSAIIETYLARPAAADARNVEIELNVFPTGRPE
jgi:DNA-binding transcriptional ArsR family regulator